ncbi:MAG: hypothetical protein ACKVOX_11080 [Rhizobacter sp.]
MPCALTLGIVFAAHAADRTPFAFTLPRDATTSAGVYDAQGHLIRTLWRAEKLPAGIHLNEWDGKDDAGKTFSGAEVALKVIHHRVSPVWEGVVGNSSIATGANLHKSFEPPTSLSIQGSQAFYAVGYNEMQPGLHGFDLAAPGRNTRPVSAKDAFTALSMIATDSSRLYWANTGGLSPSSFVGAYDLTSMRPTEFSAGRPLCLNVRPNSTRCYEDQDYTSVFDVEAARVDMPTGLAVQRVGNVLAVAHAGKNVVRLFDKKSGAPLREIAVSLVPNSKNQLAMSSAGDLWVISGKSVLRYTGLDSEPRLAATISTLTQPLALAAGEGSGDAVWVADGGESQQVKKFNREGQPVITIGVKGGYATDPKVTGNKLCFQAREGREQAAMGVAADGSAWVLDYCNNRMLHFTSSGRNDGQIAYLPASYAATVDHGSPQRVFANFLEFEVDRNAPLQPGKSWQLVRNWLAGLPPSLVDDRSYNAGFGGFTSVETLSNGRTYGLLQAKGRQVIVELPASGPLRIVRTLAQPMAHATARVLYENGDLGYSLTGPNAQSALRQPLKGFDSAGDPVWAVEPVLVASVPTLPGSPYYRGAFSGMPPRFPITASGNVVYFDQSVQGNEGFHLGSAKKGSTEWLWQASPTGPLDDKGSFQTKKLDQSINYGGNAVWAHGRNIIYGYHGEFFRDMKNGGVGQANQFMHFDESGLFISQFGQPSTRPAAANLAGLSGNAFSPTLVQDGRNLYLYHNDESSHGGVHRWRIDGWADIVELNGRGSPGSQIILQ